ncbi:unnamed protein product [Bursaphelenchus okinawaensis]|uniref:Uncharacterized protein n=1 Tax=Bursaphelenchus okinawaensis TaxID=465554 RepID=A0A811L0R7_9BILA|nr:unnamed protein product [Bursaphelenchus okinawaensis]CAG9114669.1 unnamed protein product [Bursaphelenchus okinawaensis]
MTNLPDVTCSTLSLPAQKSTSKQTINMVFTIDGVETLIDYNLTIKSLNQKPFVQVQAISVDGEDVVINEPNLYRVRVTDYRVRCPNQN